MTKKISNLLKLEELGQFLFSIILFEQLDFAWWWYPACILLPDLSMLGYLVNTKAGAWSYNIFHNKLLAIVIYCIGFWFGDAALLLAGLILFGHAAMDRIFGYGLKYDDDFKNTHLGWIGKTAS